MGDLVQSIKSVGVDVARFDQLLNQTGWEPTEEEDPFVVIGEQMYPVDDAFPRIIASSFTGGTVPLGVTNIRYRVDLTGPAPVALGDAEADVILRRLAEHR